MSEEKFGIDLSQGITALKVRDAMVNCFFEAHCSDAGIGLESDESEINKEYCKSIIKKAFFDVQGDFEKPSKESLQAVVKKLVGFSENFRDKDIVEKHANEIQSLIDKL